MGRRWLLDLGFANDGIGVVRAACLVMFFVLVYVVFSSGGGEGGEVGDGGASDGYYNDEIRGIIEGYATGGRGGGDSFNSKKKRKGVTLGGGGGGEGVCWRVVWLSFLSSLHPPYLLRSSFVSCCR